MPTSKVEREKVEGADKTSFRVLEAHIRGPGLVR